jgi:hypothetical protein
MISISLIFIGCYRINKYKKIEPWFKHQGTIMEIEEQHELIAVSEYYHLKFFFPTIRYRYIFDEAEYVSSSVSPHARNVWLCEIDKWGSPLDNKTKFWHAWQKGSIIDIFINSSNPSESYVVKQQSKLHRSHNYAILVGGIILLCVSFVLAIYI